MGPVDIARTNIRDAQLNANVGTASWAAHRFTGLALAGYIFMHLGVIGLSTIAGPSAFNKAMNLFQNPVVKVMEICLIAIIVFHALNGIRLTVADFFGGTREHKTMLLFVTLLTVIITVFAAKTFFPF